MNNTKMLLDAIEANPHESTPVLALADEQEELGFVLTAKMIRSGIFLTHGCDGDGGYGYGGGYGGGDGSGDGDGDGDGDGGGYGGGYGDGGDGDGYGYGDGYGGDGDGGDGEGILKQSRGIEMKDGLYIICTPGGYYPYVRVGWCKRQDIMLTMRSCRVIKKFGTNAQLAVIAKEGPKSTTQLLDASDEEGSCIGMVSRYIRCDEAAWKDACPKPKDFNGD